MLALSRLQPVAFQIGPVKVHWYGIMYLLGFAAAWWLARRRAAQPGSTWKPNDVDDLIFFCMLGVILGGRIGYVLFYGLQFWADDAWYPLKIWEGGMSFHGGLLGVVAALTLFALAARPQPGGRLRLHRAAAGARAVLRPHRQLHQQRAVGQGHHRARGGFASTAQVRHPSQLYEAALEGLLLFAVMWWFTSRPRPRLAPSGLFLAVLRRRALPGRVRARAR